MRNLVFSILIIFVFSAQAMSFEVAIDGILDDVIYGKITPLKSDISSLYLAPMEDALYIGVEVEDDNINVDTPEEFWNVSCVEIWFDWDNNDSLAFDKDDQQFWFCPAKGNGDQGYAGQWHRASDNIAQTMYDYANQSDLIDMDFAVDGGGYVMEIKIDKKALSGYLTDGTIGFTYSADKGGTKFEWEEAMLGGSFYEKPDTWPDLEIAEVLAVQPHRKLPSLWGEVKLEE